jgi:hypothetical protein
VLEDLVVSNTDGLFDPHKRVGSLKAITQANSLVRSSIAGKIPDHHSVKSVFEPEHHVAVICNYVVKLPNCVSLISMSACKLFIVMWPTGTLTSA